MNYIVVYNGLFLHFSVKEMIDLLWEQSVDVGLMNHCVI